MPTTNFLDQAGLEKLIDLFNLFVYDGDYIPDNLGELGRVGICRSGIYKKQTVNAPAGFHLTNSETTGGSNMPVGSDANGFYRDMGVNTLVPAGQSNPMSQAWGSHWFYNEQKQIVGMWNDSYGSNGTFNPAGQTGYWWFNVVEAPYGQTQIDIAKRRDNGSADYYINFVQPSPVNGMPPADGAINPPPGGNTAQFWNTNTSLVGSFIHPSPNRMIFTPQTEVIGDIWVPYTKSGKEFPDPTDIVSEILSGNINLLDVDNSNDWQTGAKTSTINPKLSNQTNNAVQGLAPNNVNSDVLWENDGTGTWVYRYRKATNGFFGNSRRLTHTTQSTTGTAVTWNINTHPNNTLTYTGTGAYLNVQLAFSELLTIAGSNATIPNTAYATLVLKQGNAAGISKKIMFSFATRQALTSGEPEIPVMNAIKWDNGTPNEIIGGNTYIFHVMRYGADWYGHWEVIDAISIPVRTGSDLPNTSPVHAVYMAPTEAKAEILAKQNPYKAFIYPTTPPYTDFTRTEYNYTGTVQTVTLPIGIYQFECWGAQCTENYQNLGGYTKGIINLLAQTTFYLFIGGMGERTARYDQKGGWNGGGGNYAAANTSTWDNGVGGGATDISLVDSPVTLDAFNRYVRTLASYIGRIMVAGGAGGGRTIHAAAAGGSVTVAATQINGTQTIAGRHSSTAALRPHTVGGFGFGMSTGFTGDDDPAGGGGYYGGGIQQDSYGGGGSSFISGMTGMNAVDAAGNHTGQPNHHSGLIFTAPVATPGVNMGNGKIIITPVVYDTFAIKMSTLVM